MKRLAIIIIPISLLFGACNDSHHGDEHDAQGKQIDNNSEIPTADYTLWTENTELFVEFPALVVDQPSRFAAHFTKMDQHKAVAQGSVTVSIITGKDKIHVTEEAPSSLGIFTPTLQPKDAGVCQLIFELITPEYADTFVIENVIIYATVAEAIDSLGAESDDANISFLKEQAWNMEFQTTPVVQREVYDVVSTSGIWKVAPTQTHTLVSNTAGKVIFNRENLTAGTRVLKNDLLLTISSENLTSNNLSSQIESAKSEFEQAESKYLRKKELYESNISPKAEFETAESEYKVAKVRYDNLRAGYINNGKQITSPVDAFIQSINVKSGDFVTEGTSLISLSNQINNMLEVKLSMEYALAAQNIKNIWYQVAPGVWSNLEDSGGEVLSVSQEVSPSEPLLSIFAKINDPVVRPTGSYTEAHVAFGKPNKSLVIPASSLLENYGQYTVIVQLSGESFENRNVEIGKRNGDWVEVKSGLEINEMVVSKGAYQVKIAALAGQAPAHGHAH